MPPSLIRSYFVLGAEASDGMRFLAGPLSIIADPDQAWPFVTVEHALSHLPTAETVASHMVWSVLRVERRISVQPVASPGGEA